MICFWASLYIWARLMGLVSFLAPLSSLSTMAFLYRARLELGGHWVDSNTGYMAWSASALEALQPSRTESNWPFFTSDIRAWKSQVWIFIFTPTAAIWAWIASAICLSMR